MTLQAQPLRLPQRNNPAKPIIKHLLRRQPRITR
jgi:hypothetical protein